MAGAVYDICNNDALCVTEQAVFDQVFSLARQVSIALVQA